MQETTPQAEQNKEPEPIHHVADKGFKVMMKEKASALELMEKFSINTLREGSQFMITTSMTRKRNEKKREIWSLLIYHYFVLHT